MPIRPDAVLLKARLSDTPRFIDLLIERVMEAGAYDAWIMPLTDHSGRPGTELTVVAPERSRTDIEAVIATNSSAAGIVVTTAEYAAIETSNEQITTRFGDVTITHRRWQGRIIDIEPDATTCAMYAREHDIPASTVWNEAYRIGEARIGQKR